jgi:pilus assembly protein CpaE
LIQTKTRAAAPSDTSFAQGTVISCMSAASGDGASTVALNLAYSLAHEYKQPTVLVDMDYQFGLVAKSLDLTAPFGIREIFDHPDRGLDDLLVSKMLVKYKDNLSIIAAPGELKLMPMVRPEVVRELVGLLRTKFTFVVIDVPHVWTDWTAAALTYSNHVVMVAQLWLRSLTHASRLLTAWNYIGVSQSGVSLVINRSGAKFKEAITAQDFERICRRKIDAYIGNDVKVITHAENNAQTIFETDINTPLKEQISNIARELLVRYVGQGAVSSIQEAAGKKSLLGFSRRRKE